MISERVLATVNFCLCCLDGTGMVNMDDTNLITQTSKERFSSHIILFVYLFRRYSFYVLCSMSCIFIHIQCSSQYMCACMCVCVCVCLYMCVLCGSYVSCYFQICYISGINMRDCGV